jgi:GNAT superfamily N-acetyltransferase
MIATDQVVEIRACRNEDVPDCLDLVKEFHEEVINDFGFGFDPLVSVNFALSQVAGCFVATVDGRIVGLIAGSIFFYPISGQKTYLESIWYVKKEHRRLGLKLLKHLEAWCKEEKVENIVMALMASDKMDKISRFYQACGYRPFEMQWVKNLKGTP